MSASEDAASSKNLGDSGGGTSGPDRGREGPPVVCVFCGASPGNSPLHMEAARSLATLFHDRGVKLVYGGGTVGIMGEVAKTLVSLSGPDSVHGVIPRALVHFERRDLGPREKLTDVIDVSLYGRTTVVPDMHSRKQLMADQVVKGGPGSGFVALSGGYGTVEELMEVTTWNQLGIHDRGVVVFNVDGYYDGLFQWVHNAVEKGFIAPSNRDIMVEAKTPQQVLDALSGYSNSEGRIKLQWNEK